MAASANVSRPSQRSLLPPISTNIAPRQLPDGPCNWKDLTAGQHEATTCGCRQFWLKEVDTNLAAQDRNPTVPAGAWCFCGHHGCFHSMLPGSDRSERVEGVGQWENQINRKDATIGQTSKHDDSPQYPSKLRESRAVTGVPSGLGINLEHYPNNTSTSSRIGQLNPQNLLADYLPSTQASSRQHSRNASIVGEAARNSAARFRSYMPAVQPQVNPQHHFLGSPRLDQCQEDDQAMSATEIATPSYSGTPALRDTDDSFRNLRQTLEAFNRQYSNDHALQQQTLAAAFIGNVSGKNPRASQSAANRNAAGATTFDPQLSNLLSQQIATLRSMLESAPNVAESLQKFNARLEALETASFCYIPPDQLSDRFEHHEGRILDVESKVQDLEKLHEDILHEARPGPRHRTLDQARDEHQRRHGGSASSDIVFDATEQAARLDIVEERLGRHEDQISGLESLAPPTAGKPWEVEVVFLPFGEGLRWLWSAARSNSQSSTKSVSGFFGHGTQSAECPEFSMDWTATVSDGLVAHACGPASGAPGLIYERLKSRGFVRTVAISGNSARHVFSTIMSSLEDVISNNHRLQDAKCHPLGLQGPYVPLRKVHRSSTLRFLTAAELTTPAIWTADFLHSTVFMRAPSTGLRRLFITEPAAYLQHLPPSVQWTWAKIRELPRYKDGVTSVVGEADALEPCWAFDNRIDPPISVHTSLSSGLSYHNSFDSHMLSPQQTGPPSPNESASKPHDIGQGTAASDSMSSLSGSSVKHTSVNHKASDPAPISPVSHFPSQQASINRMRTASLPSQPVYPESSITQRSKRVIASFDHPIQTKAIQKRRRISRSPDDVSLVGLWELTPRRSREPPSPRTNSTLPTVTWSRRPSSSGRQAAAYATPFSADRDVETMYVIEAGLDDERHYELGASGSDNYDSDNEDIEMGLETDLSDASGLEEEEEEDAYGEDDEMSDDSDESASNDKDKDGEEWEGVADDDHHQLQAVVSNGIASSSPPHHDEEGDEEDEEDDEDELGY